MHWPLRLHYVRNPSCIHQSDNSVWENTTMHWHNQITVCAQPICIDQSDDSVCVLTSTMSSLSISMTHETDVDSKLLSLGSCIDVLGDNTSYHLSADPEWRKNVPPQTRNKQRRTCAVSPPVCSSSVGERVCELHQCVPVCGTKCVLCSLWVSTNCDSVCQTCPALQSRDVPM